MHCEVNPHKGRNLVYVHGTWCYCGHLVRPLPLIFGIVGNGRMVIKLRGTVWGPRITLMWEWVRATCVHDSLLKTPYIHDQKEDHTYKSYSLFDVGARAWLHVQYVTCDSIVGTPTLPKNNDCHWMEFAHAISDYKSRRLVIWSSRIGIEMQKLFDARV